jgi:C1A family cysteine protease
MEFSMSLLASIKSFFAKLFGKSKSAEPSLASWIPDVHDPRDHTYEQVFGLGNLPTEVDLRGRFGPVEQQGALNSCVGHAVTGVLETVLKLSDRSRLFVYWNARAAEGRTGSDAGCQLRSAMKGVSTLGAADETTWSYDTSKVLSAPPAAAFTSGKPVAGLVASYVRVSTLAGLKDALANGRPVAFGFSVPDTFISITKPTGKLPYPAAGTKFIGAHAVCAVGYDDASQQVLCRNSFGPTWGMNGYFTMDYAWFNNMNALVSDAWTIVAK